MVPKKESLPETFEICIQGHITKQRANWLECQNVHHQANGITVLECTVRDQTALHGLLEKIRDLNLSIFSVKRIQPEIAAESGEIRQQK